MDISVVISTFNRAHLIDRAIQSVLDQTYPASEVIVVDDGSTDETVATVSNKSPSVNLVAQSNKGVSAARNAGIKFATGEWIAFLDSDDEWKNDKLEKQVEAIRKSHGMEVCHTDEIWIRNGRRVNPMSKHKKPDGWIFKKCLSLCCVSPSSVMIKKSLLEKVGLFDESLPACEDYDLWLRIFSQEPVLLVPESLLVKYGGHEDQLSTKFWGMDRFRVTALLKILQNGELKNADRLAVIEILKSKLDILINGLKKRDKIEELNYYVEIRSTWCEL